MSHTLPPSLLDLERAAMDVIKIMKAVPDLAKQKVAVIGGLALWNFMPRGRSTEDVDFIITLDGPKSVKPKLLALKNSPFVERAQFFFYKSPSGALVQIDFVGQFQAAYFPPTAVTVRDISPGTIPYISVDDLIVFKIFSCGLRSEVSKSRRDALDAFRLLEQKTRASGPLRLSKHQIDAVVPGLNDVVRLTNNDDAWWKNRLGLSMTTSSNPGSKQPSGHGATGSGRGTAAPGQSHQGHRGTGPANRYR
ncbi:hypothetical protein F4801DRAFT_579985 [Xylaria longipes]|nr:hypothetical protein F4801DRAFT_579985 [Xylaria longipes]